MSDSDGTQKSGKISCGQPRKRLMSAKSIPPEVRLNFHREVPIDRVRSSVPKPKGYLPPTYLPAWPEIPLDSKLPNLLVPESSLIFARGKVGQKIYQDPKYYTIYDPNHKERIIKEEYNALHDPHARGYLQKPCIKKLLLKQGLITTAGHVLCTPKDFNTYRKYLSTQYNDEVMNKLQDKHVKELAIHKADLELKQYFEKSDGANFHRAQTARQKQHKLYEERLERIEGRQRTAEFRETKWREEQLDKRYQKQMIAFEKEEQRRFRLATHRKQLREKQAQAYMMQINKEITIAERIARDKQVQAEAHRRFLMGWIDAKWDFQEERLKKDHMVRETMTSDFIERAKRRQKRVEHHREILPQIIEKQRRERDRVWNLVKKFFSRWLNKVRARKARAPDVEHQSLWDITETFDETVKYLHKESGYEKLDDFIMGIIKLKRNIQKELEREAAEEALAEAEEEEEEEEEIPIETIKAKPTTDDSDTSSSTHH